LVGPDRNLSQPSVHGQQQCVKKILNLLLSSDALLEQEKIRQIHGLKKNWDSPDNPRHLYFISIFGTPANDSTWGWRFEGHHLSLNCTLVEGKLFSVTPSFWGSSPVRANKRDGNEIEVFDKAAFEQRKSLNCSRISQIVARGGLIPTCRCCMAVHCIYF